jgi:hypothetical protein
MKKCSNCRTVVSDFAKVGNKCSRCGFVWQYEKKELSGRGSSKKNTGCILCIIVIFIIFILPIILDGRRSRHKRLDEYKLQEKWLTLNIDSVKSSLNMIMLGDLAERVRLFFNISGHYVSSLDGYQGKEKVRYIEFIPVIDSIFRNACPYLKMGPMNVAYSTQQRLSHNDDLIPEIRISADSALSSIERINRNND